MKVHVKYRVHGAAGRFRLKSYDAQPVMCCAKMSDEWGHLVEVGLHGFPAATNLRPLLLTAAYPLPDGEVVSTTMPISHCPWCGDRIEVVDIGIDATPEKPQCPSPVPTLEF